ncbi:MAG: hypothetical protein K5790_07255 [Nitrosopumilus sp.]|uniref:hypothetical protein n=1 Tax=Nitrosopumilus sp. TaxID=2024843 RepID=UPI00247B2F2D|nr:hypothetical protein [Nitrosopumilus sp.]MCV0393071.1 hypothetical protein [Nitrosopumilus sp.]
MEFEKDIHALRETLEDTENRIKKLQEHKDSVTKELKDCKSNDDSTNETLRRLEKNLEKLQKKRESIIKELEE